MLFHYGFPELERSKCVTFMLPWHCPTVLTVFARWDCRGVSQRGAGWGIHPLQLHWIRWFTYDKLKYFRIPQRRTYIQIHSLHMTHVMLSYSALPRKPDIDDGGAFHKRKVLHTPTSHNKCLSFIFRIKYVWWVHSDSRVHDLSILSICF